LQVKVDEINQEKDEIMVAMEMNKVEMQSQIDALTQAGSHNDIIKKQFVELNERYKALEEERKSFLQKKQQISKEFRELTTNLENKVQHLQHENDVLKNSPSTSPQDAEKEEFVKRTTEENMRLRNELTETKEFIAKTKTQIQNRLASKDEEIAKLREQLLRFSQENNNNVDKENADPRPQKKLGMKPPSSRQSVSGFEPGI